MNAASIGAASLSPVELIAVLVWHKMLVYELKQPWRACNHWFPTDFLMSLCASCTFWIYLLDDLRGKKPETESCWCGPIIKHPCNQSQSGFEIRELELSWAAQCCQWSLNRWYFTPPKLLHPQQLNEVCFIMWAKIRPTLSSPSEESGLWCNKVN